MHPKSVAQQICCPDFSPAETPSNAGREWDQEIYCPLLTLLPAVHSRSISKVVRSEASGEVSLPDEVYDVVPNTTCNEAMDCCRQINNTPFRMCKSFTFSRLETRYTVRSIPYTTPRTFLMTCIIIIMGSASLYAFGRFWLMLDGRRVGDKRSYPLSGR
ncbi:hypothetical protein VTN96DRAFT_537 [Rasamsonia emersonii]